MNEWMNDWLIDWLGMIDWLIDWFKFQDEPLVVRMHTFRCQTLLNFLRVQLPSCNLFKTKTRRYEWTERENTRISRVQACSEAAPVNKAEWDKRATPEKAPTSRWSTKGCAQSLRAEEKSQEAQKRLKAQRQGGASRRQCQTAEQRTRKLPDQIAESKARHRENVTTTTTAAMQPATRNYLHNQQLRIQRQCEQRRLRLEREILYTISYQWI